MRAGVFNDVDATLFTHVGNNLRRVVGRRWRQRPDRQIRVHLRRQAAHAPARRGVAAGPRCVDPRTCAETFRASTSSVPPFALGDHRRRRSATLCRGPPACGSSSASRSTARQGAVRARRYDGARRRHDDRHQVELAHPRLGVERHFNKPIADTATPTSSRWGCPRGASRRWPCRRSSATRPAGLTTKLAVMGQPGPSQAATWAADDIGGDVSWNCPR